MKRFVASVMLGYLVLAAVSRGKEAIGLITHNPGLEAWKKQQLDPSA